MFGREKRFVIYSEGMGLGQIKILMDRVTGVHYLFYSDGSAGGITPLLNSSGEPVVEGFASDDDDDL